MSFEMRKTLGARVAALGFILLTLLGNYWLVIGIMAMPVPGILVDLFVLFAAMTGIGGAMITYSYVKSVLNPGSSEESDA